MAFTVYGIIEGPRTVDNFVRQGEIILLTDKDKTEEGIDVKEQEVRLQALEFEVLRFTEGMHGSDLFKFLRMNMKEIEFGLFEDMIDDLFNRVVKLIMSKTIIRIFLTMVFDKIKYRREIDSSTLFSSAYGEQNKKVVRTKADVQPVDVSVKIREWAKIEGRVYGRGGNRSDCYAVEKVTMTRFGPEIAWKRVNGELGGETIWFRFIPCCGKDVVDRVHLATLSKYLSVARSKKFTNRLCNLISDLMFIIKGFEGFGGDKLLDGSSVGLIPKRIHMELNGKYDKMDGINCCQLILPILIRIRESMEPTNVMDLAIQLTRMVARYALTNVSGEGIRIYLDSRDSMGYGESVRDVVDVDFAGESTGQGLRRIDQDNIKIKADYRANRSKGTGIREGLIMMNALGMSKEKSMRLKICLRWLVSAKVMEAKVARGEIQSHELNIIDNDYVKEEMMMSPVVPAHGLQKRKECAEKDRMMKRRFGQNMVDSRSQAQLLAIISKSREDYGSMYLTQRNFEEGIILAETDRVMRIWEC
eukprot:Plantae.Rhodophyta-Hildenbrandia_rubra.ctg6697.p1 GENE.Plantae.Rhodophyta-Hildenbrandia_rubra.ctg6697~~Plantae.Rhodophyta-Hildenbrandia_rubra.ctg6697.p1  ORF type:complete len:583 (-),score=46.39 Plantae.Rhodophyta-Hildenbrandia_rubra.ctg6697:1545-3134(-)